MNRKGFLLSLYDCVKKKFNFFQNIFKLFFSFLLQALTTPQIGLNFFLLFDFQFKVKKPFII